MTAAQKTIWEHTVVLSGPDDGPEAAINVAVQSAGDAVRVRVHACGGNCETGDDEWITLALNADQFHELADVIERAKQLMALAPPAKKRSRGIRTISTTRDL